MRRGVRAGARRGHGNACGKEDSSEFHCLGCLLVVGVLEY